MKGQTNQYKAFLVLMVFVFFVSSLHVFAQQSAEELYEEAMFKKESVGDLQGAIQILAKVIKEFPANKTVSGKAQLQIGMCYEKLGKVEAIKAYEKILKNYSDQPHLVATARERIEALKVKDQTGLKVKELPDSLEEPHYSRDGTKVVGNTWSIPGQNIGVYDYTTGKLIPITHFKWKTEGHGITYWAIISPDAKEVAYWFSYHNKGGDELRVSTLDGKSRTLYRNDTRTILPCDWLPDGSAVLSFRHNEMQSWELGLVHAEGGEFKVLRDIGPKRTNAAISPDGRFISYGDGPQGKRDIKLMTVEGKAVGALTSHPANDEKALWSPDGNHVVFKSDRHGGTGLWGVAVQEGKPTGQPVLIKPGMENTELINWTSQGLACGTTIITRDVFVMSMDPLSMEPLAEARLIDYTPTGDNMSPVWSPNGKHLAFLSIRDKAYIVVMPAAGGKAKEFLVPMDNFWGIGKWWLMHLAWLPDSSGIGFKTMWALPGETLPTLICLDLASGDWKRWHVPVSWNGTWGMDGTSYIYEEEQKNVGKGLVERDLEIGEERFIYKYPYEEIGSIRRLTSSLDYKKVLFVRGDIGWSILDLETGNVKVLEGLIMGRPSFSPDNKHIFGIDIEEDGPLKKMFIIPLDGGPRKDIDLGNNLPKGYQLRRPHWSPDWKQIAFHTRSWFEEDFFLQNVIPESLKK